MSHFLPQNHLLVCILFPVTIIVRDFIKVIPLKKRSIKQLFLKFHPVGNHVMCIRKIQ